MKDRIIVNAAIGFHYRSQCESMRWHCQQHCSTDHDFAFWDDYPPRCPTQRERNYAFKKFGIEHAIQQGYRRILWMDVVYMPQRALTDLWNVVGEQGWYIPPQGDAVLGNWCSDACLDAFGVPRDVAMNIPLCFSGLVGLDLDHATGRHIWDLWRLSYEHGTWQGPHVNEPGEPIHDWGQKFAGHCSDDKRCLGHRHDESALSCILHNLGLKPELRGVLGNSIKMHVRKPQ